MLRPTFLSVFVFRINSLLLLLLLFFRWRVARQVCLELLIAVALRNRHRIPLLVFLFFFFRWRVALQVCLELLIAVALRNRDRIVLIWPLLHEYLNAIMTPNGAKAANPLVARVCLPFSFAFRAFLVCLLCLSVCLLCQTNVPFVPSIPFDMYGVATIEVVCRECGCVFDLPFCKVMIMQSPLNIKYAGGDQANRIQQYIGVS